ncbi:uncharacterized protein LOC122567561 isoform X2 [Bombus pyrosoma]|uniref:uncharacterized protein LOC122567561 isoform X2 n=1 Tax=Bombus pyrosoma TaxID=396416 RepID=UPI001CB89651|nr:uncharacterized protein LOC122567561 isoform X2 [Bombus pyrosoma]
MTPRSMFRSQSVVDETPSTTTLSSFVDSSIRRFVEQSRETKLLMFWNSRLNKKKRCPWRDSVSNERLDDAEDERGVTTSPADRRSRSPPGMETDRQASSRTWGHCARSVAYIPRI